MLIETHGALRDAAEIARAAVDAGARLRPDGLRVAATTARFPPAAMRSPGQFEHALIARAKARRGRRGAGARRGSGAQRHARPQERLPDLRRRLARAQRVRLPAHVVDLPGADPADRRRDEARLLARSRTRRAILLAAQKADWGPIQYAGELHDRATYRYFWELLQKAKVTGVALPEEAAKAFF